MVWPIYLSSKNNSFKFVIKFLSVYNIDYPYKIDNTTSKKKPTFTFFVLILLVQLIGFLYSPFALLLPYWSNSETIKLILAQNNNLRTIALNSSKLLDRRYSSKDVYPTLTCTALDHVQQVKLQRQTYIAYY